ncbi:unnamed protein product [Candida verbasci]|uniref:DUF676 domain-containing protein n=1 Tax=Candida verbasci TaxID=1227364 RepID=A0A9W4TT06_9ASCO|nr:unnamed protein product [Candida verbasci]
MVDYHLVVLVHGIWGNSSHLAYVEKQMKEQIKTNDGSKLLLHKTGSHSGYLTYDGIDVNGKRISDEIIEQTSKIESTIGNKVTKFSIIGYSLGGLISRYAIGILHSQGYFDKVEPINFNTFCTPHVGVSNPQTHNLSVRVYNSVAPHFLALTGYQFFLRDKVGQLNKPLLVWMADPNSPFYKSLKNFKYKSLYANVLNDKRCSWFTASISRDDPINSMYNKSAKNIIIEDYIKGYESTIINIQKPFYFERSKHSVTYNDGSKIRFLWKTLNWIKIISTIILYTPVWAISFIVSSIYQRIKMNNRLKEFFKTNDLLHLYKPSTGSESDSDEAGGIFSELSEKVQDEQEDIVEDMYSAMNYKESYSKHIIPIKLDSHQKFIVDKLNTLNWKKFPIILRNTVSTHAGAIVRHNDPHFDEGKVVVAHFINEIFRLE